MKKKNIFITLNFEVKTNNMNPFSNNCLTCNKERTGCSVCRLTHSRFCSEHSPYSFRQNPETSTWYCDSCYEKSKCPKCQTNTVMKCQLCRTETNTCGACCTLSILDSKVCKKCFDKHHCLKCDNHRTVSRCSQCRSAACGVCQPLLHIDISPMTLAQIRIRERGDDSHGMVNLIARSKSVCFPCLKNRTVLEYQLDYIDYEDKNPHDKEKQACRTCHKEEQQCSRCEHCYYLACSECSPLQPVDITRLRNLGIYAKNDFRMWCQTCHDQLKTNPYIC